MALGVLTHQSSEHRSIVRPEGQTALYDNHAGTLGINGHIGYGDHTVALEHSRGRVSNEKECRDDDVRDGFLLVACADGAPSGTETADADSGPIRAPVPTGDAGPLEPSDAAYPDGGIMPPADGRPSLGLDVACDLEDATRYENFVLAENCPGDCCWEYPGNLSDQGPQPMGVPMPIIHSAYHDYPTVNLKSDVPSAIDDLRYYVPLAKYSLPDHLNETLVGCVEDADCSAIGAGLAATCARQDGDDNGVDYAESRSTEYQACIPMPRVRQDACVSDGGLGGDLATQSAVPSMITDGLCSDVSPPGDAECSSILSACVYSPAWVSHPTEQGPDPDRRAPPIIRPSGRLFVQGIHLIDTAFEAYFVRLRSADRNGESTEFTRVVSDPITGEPVVRLRNDAVCSFSDDGEGDCNPLNRRGLRRLAVQPSTYTRGAEAAQTWQADEVLTPIYWYLERENQWLRYHRRTDDAEGGAYQAAELYDDLVIVDVPDDMAPGLYSVQLKYSANTWLEALDETHGRQRSCEARNTIAAECQSNFENPSIGALECGELEAECQSDDALYLFDTDRALMTNPIYVQIAPNFVEQTYRVSLTGFTPIVSGEYGPRPGGPWVYDDVRLFSMIVRFDPNQLGPDENCGVGNDPSGAENPVCHVAGPWVFEQDDIFVDRRYDLSGRGSPRILAFVPVK